MADVIVCGINISHLVENETFLKIFKNFRCFLREYLFKITTWGHIFSFKLKPINSSQYFPLSCGLLYLKKIDY